MAWGNSAAAMHLPLQALEYRSRGASSVIAEHDRQTGHAFAADQPDLGLFAIDLNCNNGCEPRLGKINYSIRLLGFSRDFRSCRGTVSKFGSSRSKSWVEEYQSFSHRRLRRRASAGGEPVR